MKEKEKKAEQRVTSAAVSVLKSVTWIGDAPTKCDICKKPITTVFVDGRTSRGPWACMCVACHATHGTGLGTGQGQQYEKQTVRVNGIDHDGYEWVKVRG